MINEDIENPILQGADQDIEITIRDEDNDVYDMSGATKLAVVIMYSDYTILAKYSKNASSGWKDLDVTDAATGILRFKIESSETLDALEGKIFAEVKGRWPDVDYEDGYNDTLGQFYIGEIVKSVTNDLTIP